MRIKEKHPEFHLTWMTDSMYADIVRAQPWVDGVIEWDRKNTGNRGYREILKKVRRMGFDMLVDMHATDRSSIFAMFSGIKKRYVIHWHFPLAHTDFGLNDLMDVTLDISQCPLYLYAPPVDSSKYAVFGNKHKKLGLAIGASTAVKRWPVCRWIEFCDMASNAGYDMFLMGNGHIESEIAEQIVSMVNSKHIVNLVGQTTTTDLITLTSKMDVVIAGDTGLMHIARALGVPVIGLFGPNYPTAGDRYMKSLGACYFCNCVDKGCQKAKCCRQCLEDIDAVTIFEGTSAILAHTN